MRLLGLRRSARRLIDRREQVNGPRGRKKCGVNEVRTPALETDPFEVYFHDLIVGTLVRSAEEELEYRRARGHRLRARRAERMVEGMRELTVTPEPGDAVAGRTFSTGLQTFATAAWLASCALLVADILVFGIHYWTTTVADLGTALLTIVWFSLSFRQPQQNAESPDAEP